MIDINYNELIERLRTESLYRDKATLEIMDLCMEAADVAPVVHGWWEYIGTDEKGHIFICSNCRNRIGLDAETDFCPNCGAKMDGDAGE